jgi:hypothetical protein
MATLASALLMAAPTPSPAIETGMLRVSIVDDATSEPVAARVYITGSDGKPYLPKPQPGQTIAHYDVARGPREVYACIGAHPFEVELPAGEATLLIERGKEYLPLARELTITPGDTHETTIRMLRLFDLASMGWYSGDLHVHTPPEKLAAFQLAEDLNVTFPITAWATSDEHAPRNPKGKVPEKGELISIDDTHVYWTLNSEYELFTAKGIEGELGAVLLLGHQQPFTQLAPPIGPICEEARRQNAIIDWDKHSWPWSTMLIPVCGVQTIELSNNHMWRLPPHFLTWGEPAPEWMNVQATARGWAEYGMQAYYALLNCGFNLRPSAGTANGVHPVPLGHSRVYVYIEGKFSYDKWVQGLRAGRSFVTNGPVLRLFVDEHIPGDRIALGPDETRQIVAAVEARSAGRVDRIELICNGKVVFTYDPNRGEGGTSPHFRRFRAPVDIHGTSWLAVRCFESAPDDNVRFAHTAPIFFDDPTVPLRPERRELQWLIDSISRQIERLDGKLSDEAVAEYERALAEYRALVPAGK